MAESEFEFELKSLLNRHSQENESNTPDYILARYLNGCLRLFNATVNSRSDWYGRRDRPGHVKWDEAMGQVIRPTSRDE